MFLLEYAAATHEGKVRRRNEDNFCINGVLRENDFGQSMEHSGCMEKGFLAACVCDGMGGEACGDWASLVAVQTLRNILFEGKREGAEILSAFVEEANRVICERIKEEKKRIGSTLAMLLFTKDRVCSYNLGDSRCYMLRNRKLRQISHDHSEVGRMIEMGMLTKEQARTHRDRHKITQHLGIFPEEMLLEPFVSETYPLKAGDIYLICSDGITDMLEDEELTEILSERKSTEEKAEMLRDKALLAGGKDNITAIVIHVMKK